MAGADTIERLRQYLRELSPQARSLLIGELERSLLRSDASSSADLTLQEMLLQELRRVVREQREGAPRIGNAARLFFKPLEPFLVDDRGDHNHPGRIARSSLELLWTWIRRDLLPEDSKTVADTVGDALLAGDEPKAQHITRVFQARVVAAIEAELHSAAADENSAAACWRKSAPSARPMMPRRSNACSNTATIWRRWRRICRSVSAIWPARSWMSARD